MCIDNMMIRIVFCKLICYFGVMLRKDRNEVVIFSVMVFSVVLMGEILLLMKLLLFRIMVVIEISV